MNVIPRFTHYSLAPGNALIHVFAINSAEAEAEKPAAEADHGPAPQPHLGDQLHAGREELNHTHTYSCDVDM